MSVTVPIGPKAVQEAWDKLLPSKNLLKPGQDRPIIQPTEESIAGLYAGTRKKRETGLKFDKAADVMKAMDAGEIQPTDGITLGDTKTTAGHVLAMQKVPKAFRDYSSVLSSKNVEQILARIAKEQPKAYSKAVRGLKDAGDIMATEMGLSFQASDFTPIRDKSEIARLKPGQELTQTQKNRIARRLRQHLGEDSVLAIMADSGAKGSWNNIQQMLYSPISVKDATGQTVPHLIRRGFAEGLSFKDYWSAAKGARKGLIDKGVQTAHPGYFGKEILRSSLGGVIQQGDADDPEGVDYPVEHPTVMNRYLAADVVDGNGEVIAKAGDPVTSELVQAAKRLRIKKLSVRSPLTTKANDGFYAKDFGRMPGDRKLRPGSDVGIVAGQTLTEPATQLTLKKFHAGGSGDAASVAGLDQAWDILKGKAPEGTRAPLSPRKAKVASIETLPSGASVITLSTGEKINAAPGRSLTVKQGDTVEKGQQLQEGNPDPQDVLRYRGFRPMQMYMVDQIEKAYGKYAPDRRYIETVVGGLTRYARVRDPGDSDYAPGEIVPINKLKSYNKQATGGLPVAYEPHFLGIGPSGVKAKQDWASAMLHGDLARRVPDLAAAGATSPVHSTDPTMPYLHSAEFGDELEEGRY
jgi:DNA-directed RNA polymerase subunit beta'